MADQELRQREMREFLWTHWKARTPAVLLKANISKEGKRTDSTFQIKLVPPASWIMQVTIVRERYGFDGSVFRREDAKYDVYTVERIRPNNPFLLTRSSKVEVLSDDAVLSGSEYCLRLKGWGGEVESFL